MTKSGYNDTKMHGTDFLKKNTIFIWLAIATATILLVPLIGEWPWTLSDFIVMGALLFGSSSLFVLVARKVERRHRLMVGGAILLGVLWLWAELAVGVFTNWGS